ncbi:hypothetical protein K7432_012009 [Basidiobolus ranarum]|uniref:Carrier domain-containing protein n=1 Tax=Basidiobolus ranarum TaxID=34480 RepID=A0ABR2VSY2_9FUNG
MITRCTQMDIVEHTRSDFPLLKLSETAFNALYNDILLQTGVDSSNIEDILPCTHLQEGLIAGMLKSSDYYHVQQTFDIVGEFDLGKFQNAWNTVIQDHPILHSIFVQNSTPNESSITFYQVAIKHFTHQWTQFNCSEASLEATINQCLDTDKSKFFNFGEPNMRLALIETDTNKRVFIVSWHHAILDATSWKIVLQDIHAVYNYHPRPKTYPFKDFVSDLLDHTQNFITEEQDYWMSKFSQLNIEPFPKLEASEQSESGMIRISDAIELSIQTIEQFARLSKVTIFTLIKAAWAMLLREYTQCEDVAFGYTISGRNSELVGISSIVGPCINTLPCHIHFEGQVTVGEWLQNAHSDYISSLSYQQSSLRDIQGCVGISPLIDTLLDYKNELTTKSESDTIKPPGIRADTLVLIPIAGDEKTEYPLGIFIESDDHNLTYTVTISRKLATIPHAERLSRCFKILFESLVSSTLDAKLETIKIGLNEGRESFSNSSSSMDVNTTYLHHTFEKQADLHPDNLAVQFKNSEYVTYGELNRRANKLAHHLNELGVRPESMVPLCLEKSVSMIVAMLAVLKAGGAYVPFDPNYPVERNLFILNETKAKIVITLEKYKERFGNNHLVLLDIDEDVIQQKADDNLQTNGLTPLNLCYVMYTSGSTGAPKGVMLEHTALVNFIFSFRKMWNLTKHDLVLQFTNYTFDVSIMDIFGTLASGACVAMASEEDLRTNLEEIINTMDITSLVLTPTVVSFIDPSKVPSVKRLLLAGEMITPTVRNAWLPYVDFFNAYGPTEASVIVSVNILLDEQSSCSNIGLPIGNNEMCILGLDMYPVPVGVVGELCISGPQLARGYLNRPDLTDKAFVSNDQAGGTRFYRTGDLARFNSDGSVELIGRKDNQIKLNGLRIELDEIEHALCGHSKVTRACVLPLITDQSTNRKSLVAFLGFSDIMNDNHSLRLLSGSCAEVAVVHMEELKNQVRKRLPSYMVPNIWVPLGSIPINTSGKIDRKRLATFFESLSLEDVIGLSIGSREQDTTSFTPLEKMLQNIWSEILNISASSINIDDSFYQLGGDSITAIRVSSSIGQHGFTLSVRQIMQNPTIRAQASAAILVATTALESPKIALDEVSLTPVLKHFLDTPQDNVHHFNQSWLLKLRDSITQGSLEVAISSLMQHHELLRSRFVYSGDQWKIKILSIEQVQYKIHHTKIDSLDEMKEHIHKLQQSLNLVSGPVFQVSMYDLNDGNQLLFMTGHRFVIDLVSWRIIWEDLEQLLQGKEYGYKSMSFMQWSSMLDDYAQSLDMEVWPVQEVSQPLITDLSLLEQNTMQSAKSVSFTLTPLKTEQLFSQANIPFQTEATDLMISSLVIAYCSVFNSSSMTIGLEGHGREPWREDIDISRTVGWFTTLYPMVVNVQQTDDLLTILKRVKDMRKLIPGNGIVYGLLRDLNRSQENPLKDDIIQIGFNYTGRFQQLENENSFFQPVESPYNFDTGDVDQHWRRNHVFDILTRVNQDGLQANIVYSSVLHSEDIVSQWLYTWQEVLNTMITRCTQMDIVEHTRSDFPLLKLSESAFDVLYNDILLQTGVDSSNIEDILPCTHLQEGLIAGMLKSSDYYHVQQTFDIVGDFDWVKFENAWQTVVQDHPILHSVFVQNSVIDDSSITFFQVAIRDYIQQWSRITCSEESMEDMVCKYFADDSEKYFNLGQPNMRLALLETETGKRVLCISWHHAILDATSWKIVLEDICTVYSQQPRPKTYPFKNFVASLHNRTSAFIVEEKAYWMKKFSQLDITSFPKLETLNQVDLGMILLSGVIELPLQLIAGFARQWKVTVFTIIKAVWALLLREYIQNDDVVFGYTINGRNGELEGVSSMIGPCINTLPCYIRYESQSTIGEWLQSIHSDYNTSLSYQQSSLRDIQSWTGISPLFDTLLDYKVNSETEKNTLNTLEIIPLSGDGSVEYPLGLAVESNSDELSYSIMIDRNLATMKHAQKLSSNFKNLFESLVSSTTDARLDTLNIGWDEDLELFSHSSSSTDFQGVNEICLHRILEEQADLHPDNLAVKFKDSEYVTYGELNRRANQLAHHLIELGIRPESMVPLCLEKSVSMIVAILAVLKAGGAYVPLDPNNPVERNLFILNETKAEVVVTFDQYKHNFDGQHLVLLDIIGEVIEQQMEANPMVQGLTPSNLCYILYTSGSTGTPKGIMMEHSGVVSYMKGLRKVWNITSHDTVLQFSNYTFDMSVTEMFGTFAVGGSVALASKEDLLSNLEEMINMMGVTALAITPTIATFIDPLKVPSVNRLVLGGEMFTTNVLNKWLPYVELSNGYGPTEAAVVILVNCPMNKQTSCDNIGKPIGNNKIYILNNDLRPVPLGVAGELCVSGPQLARGYLNRPDLTDKAFVSSPFAAGERLYRTGDLAYFNSDGSVELIGRKDNQIKLNGLRIELDEIEHVICDLSKVARACVLPLITDQSTNRKSLVAFLTFCDITDDNISLEVLSGSRAEVAAVYIKELKKQVKAQLPSYMVPNIWVPLGSIPINTSGKIDRKRLATFFESLSLEAVIGLKNGASGRRF